MINDIIESIVTYTEYLKNNLKLNVSFCNISNYFEKYMYIFYQFNSHPIVYCDLIKKKKESFEKCVRKQWNVLSKCKDGPFYGICWAGIEEYVFPIVCNNIALGFISVSGYRGKFDTAISRLKKVSNDFGYNYETLYKTFMQSTSDTIPNFENVKTIIAPLAIMFERLYLENPIEPKTDTKEFSVYEKILMYLTRNYMQNLTLERIAKDLNYSVSYVRQIFKKRSNHTIGEYIVNLKMKKAAELLINTSISVASVAANTGFVDANYFSTKFKTHYKVSPLEYRKINATQKQDSNIEKLMF